MATDVLLVDDYAEARDSLAALLESEGYRVACAADGREALAKLRRGIGPSLIVLDVQMPRMSGPEFRREQLGDPRLANIPVVVCSAADSVSLAAAMEGVVRWLSKPVDGDALLAVVGLYCRRRTGRRGLRGRRIE